MQAVILPNGTVLEVRVNAKCGKTTVHSILCYPYRNKHKEIMDSARYLRQIGRAVSPTVCEPDHRIAVVRDPVERLVSAYKDRILVKNKERLQQTIRSWQEFLLNLHSLQQNSADIHAHTRPQSRLLGSAVEIYDRIFSTHQLSTEFLSWVNTAGDCAIPPVAHNTTAHHPEYEISVTPSQRDFIKERYESDYRYYGAYFDPI